MNVLVSDGNISAETAEVNVPEDGTALDILKALEESGVFGVNLKKERYILAFKENNLQPNQSLSQAGVSDGDVLVLSSNEQGY